MEKVVVTGMGTVNPVGIGVDQTWKSLIKGQTGIAPITLFDSSEYLVKIAGEVKNFNPADFMDAKEARRRDRFEQLAIVAANEAIHNAGLNFEEIDRSRVGVVVSSAIGGMKSLQDGIFCLKEEGPRKVSPFLIPMLMPNGASGLIAIDHGLNGPCFSVASACASGIDSLGMAYTMIRSGMVDVVIAGASEATICEIGVAAFDRIGAMSRRNEPDHCAPAPFDKDRDGLVMGEGAGILVLESESSARKRSANILAEFAGYGSTADAYHVTAPDVGGRGGAAAILMALKSAEINLNDVDYINAHGTGTPLNDAAETRAIKNAFGELAYKIPVSSTKSMTGHMMGATGALEAIICIKTIQEGIIPPTINLNSPDPECDLDYVPNKSRMKQVEIAISNAFGFGGHNAVMVVRRTLP